MTPEARAQLSNFGIEPDVLPRKPGFYFDRFPTRAD
jgi:hypothetical protein